MHEIDKIPVEFDDNMHHHMALALAHNVSSYERFLEGANDFLEQEKILEDRYGMSPFHGRKIISE